MDYDWKYEIHFLYYTIGLYINIFQARCFLKHAHRQSSFWDISWAIKD